MNVKKELYVYLRNKVTPNFPFSHRTINTDEMKELFIKYDKWKGQSEFNLFNLTNCYYKDKILNQKTKKVLSRNSHVKNPKIQKSLKKNFSPSSLFSNPSSYLTDRFEEAQKTITFFNRNHKYPRTPLKSHLEFNNPIIDYISKIIKNQRTKNQTLPSKTKNIKRPVTTSYKKKKIKLNFNSKNKLNFHDFTYKKFNTIIKQPPINKKVPKKFLLYEKADELDLFFGQKITDEKNSKLVLRGLALDKIRKSYYEKCQMSVFKEGNAGSFYSEDKNNINSEVINSNLYNVQSINSLSNNFSNNMSNHNNRILKRKKNIYLGINYENKDKKFKYSLKGLVNNAQPILINSSK